MLHEHAPRSSSCVEEVLREHVNGVDGAEVREWHGALRVGPCKGWKEWESVMVSSTSMCRRELKNSSSGGTTSSARSMGALRGSGAHMLRCMRDARGTPGAMVQLERRAPSTKRQWRRGWRGSWRAGAPRCCGAFRGGAEVQLLYMEEVLREHVDGVKVRPLRCRACARRRARR